MGAEEWAITQVVFIKSLWWIIPIVVGIVASAIMEHFE